MAEATEIINSEEETREYAPLEVMYFDFDTNGTGKRPGNNSSLLKQAAEAAGLDVNVHQFGRLGSSRYWTGVEDILLSGERPSFDAVIIYMAAKDASEALDAAVMSFDEFDISAERIICLYPGKPNGNCAYQDVQKVCVKGGNGHFDIDSISEVLSMVRRLGKLDS